MSPLLQLLGLVAAFWATVNLCFRMASRARAAGADPENSTFQAGREKRKGTNTPKTPAKAASEQPPPGRKTGTQARSSSSSRSGGGGGDSKDAGGSSRSLELVSAVHLRYTTRAFNAPIRWLATAGSQGTSGVARAVRRAIDLWYDAGIMLGVSAMVLCGAIMAVASVQIALGLAAKTYAFAQRTGQCAPNEAVLWGLRYVIELVNGIGTRPRAAGPGAAQQAEGLGYGGPGQPGSGDDVNQLLKPIIPGVTLPLGHTLQYLGALLACALGHELGHALAAESAGVRMRSFGMLLLGIYPGAFVDLSERDIERKPLRRRLQIVWAGVWHNAAMALVVWLAIHAGWLRAMFGCAGWADVDDGVAVLDIAKGSPLHGTIPVHSTIFQIDDAPLGATAATSPEWEARLGSGTPVSRWTQILTATVSNRDTYSGGFCVCASENADDGLCCEMTPRFPLGESPDPGVFCFEEYAGADASGRRALPMRHECAAESMCFDLAAVFGRAGARRCRSHGDCAQHYRSEPASNGGGGAPTPLCVIPRSPFREGRVMRIHYRTHSTNRGAGSSVSGADQLAVYAGSPVALWLDVHVSSLVPRFGWLPSQMPSWTESLLRYVLAFSLALCLLNSLPAYQLDGSHGLHLLLQAVDRSRSRAGAKETPSGGGVACADWVDRVHGRVVAAVSVLLVWCVCGSVLLIIL